MLSAFCNEVARVATNRVWLVSWLDIVDHMFVNEAVILLDRTDVQKNSWEQV
jgi:hypothetical protein